MAAERVVAGPHPLPLPQRGSGDGLPGWITGWVKNGLAVVLAAEPRTPLSSRAIAADWLVGVTAAMAAVIGVIVAHLRQQDATAGYVGYVGWKPAPGPGWVLLAGVALTAAPLAFRRRWPIAAFWVILVAVIATGNNATIVTIVAVILAAYCAVAYSRFRALAVASLVTGGIITAAAFPDTTPPLPGRYTALLMLGMTAAIAGVIRQWRARAGDSAERLRRAEAEHEAATRRALELERARIASELHDVVTHNVSVMVVQAGAARQVLADSPGEAREALLAVEASGRTAMAELRHLLGLLCPSGEAGAADVMLRPQPGLGELDGLIGRVRAAGLPVELSAEGTRQVLPPGLDLAAYRVVQEALTNVIKHAGRPRTAVRLGYRSGELTIEVADDGMADGQPGGPVSPRAAAAPSRAGRGLIGLRERIAMYGGELDAGPRPGGGWRVRARIPVDVPAAPPMAAGPPLPADLRMAGP